MKHFLIILTTFLSLAASISLQASTPAKSAQQKYIDKYADLAVKEMRRTGIPASITLAQGLLESRYGQSELAVKANNHFGIKCHSNWNGPSVRMDDDKKRECFRKYRTVEQSYRDHSDFLVYRDRYKFLFDLDRKDYKGWAYGLKKAGYATDQAYAKKLINIIEEYELYRYDGGIRLVKTKQEREAADAEREAAQAERAAAELEQEAVKQADVASKLEDKAQRAAQREARRAAKAAEKAAKKTPKASADQDGPESAGESVSTETEIYETFSFSLSRQKYSQNGVPFIYSSKGDTYASIAQANNLFLKEILRFNDLDADETLHPGTIVYIQPKKKQASKGLDKHIVDNPSETLYDIAQRYAITLKSLCKLNDLTPDHKLREGDEVRLRKGR